MKAVETAIVEENLKGEFNPTSCSIDGNGNLACNGRSVVVEVDGEKPIDGTIFFDNGKITTFENVEFSSNNILMKTRDGAIVIMSSKSNDGDNSGIISNGTIVYYDVDNGAICSNYTEEQSRFGVKTGCMKFYVFNDTKDSETVNLLLDHDISYSTWIIETDFVPREPNDWFDKKVNYNGPVTLLKQLKLDTDSWITPTIPVSHNYTDVAQGYTINYNQEGYKARLITADEIAQIIKINNWDHDTEIAFYDMNSWDEYTDSVDSDDKLPQFFVDINYKNGWLYDRLGSECRIFGCINDGDSDKHKGYWTASAISSDQRMAWKIDAEGGMVDGRAEDTEGMARLRPVIVIEKSLIAH